MVPLHGQYWIAETLKRFSKEGISVQTKTICSLLIVMVHHCGRLQQFKQTMKRRGCHQGVP